PAIATDIADAGDETPASPRFRSCLILPRFSPATAYQVRRSGLVLTPRLITRCLWRGILPQVAQGPAPPELKPIAARKFVQRLMCLRARGRHARERAVHPRGPMLYPHHV